MKIFIGGDCCLNGRVEQVNAKGVLDQIKDVLNQVDYSIVNLESPLTQSMDARAKSGPHLKAKPASIKVLKEAGISCVTLANNHIMDYGTEGLKDTILTLESNSIEYLGAGFSYEEASIVKSLNIDGASIGIINITEEEWSTTLGDEAGANPINLPLNYPLIKKAVNNHDHTLLIIHGGIEGFELPTPKNRDLYRLYTEFGVSAIVIHHTHITSGFETYNGVPIFYGLGNMIFDGKGGQEWNKGLGITLNFGEETTFELTFFDQCNGEAKLMLVDAQEKELRFKRLVDLSKIITDDKLLKNKFSEFVVNQKTMYSNFILPFNSILFRGLRKFKIIPDLWKGKKKRYLLNIIRCSSHREVLIKLLS